MVKKKKISIWTISYLIILLLMSQWFASHLSLWERSIGSFDILQLSSVVNYFGIVPFIPKIFFNIFALKKTSYLVVYSCFFIYQVLSSLKVERPKGDKATKGIEYGSDHFMSKVEIAEYKKERMTKDFPYSRDCRIDAF